MLKDWSERKSTQAQKIHKLMIERKDSESKRVTSEKHRITVSAAGEFVVTDRFVCFNAARTRK